MGDGKIIRRVGVFCGSSPGANPAYVVLAKRLGALLARRRLTLVYGGGCVGLMGAIADETLARGGDVIGVIPRMLAVKEVAHMGLADLRIVSSMHERKALMGDLADAFIALPGGLGTLEEFFEVVTWAQLGLHQKPCGLINADDYFRDLIRFLDQLVVERFARPEHRGLILVEQDPEALLDQFDTYQAPELEKWLDRGST